METAHNALEIPEAAALPLEAQHQRLLTLVADLLLENQQLSCKVERLQAELETSERGLRSATRWAGALF